MAKDDRILAYLLRVGGDGRQYQGYFAEVENTPKALRTFVGGETAAFPLNDELEIIYGDKALIQGKPLNRALYDLNGSLTNAFLGNIMVVRREGKAFSGIRHEDREMIEKCLKPVVRIFAGHVFTSDAEELPVWETDSAAASDAAGAGRHGG